MKKQKTYQKPKMKLREVYRRLKPASKIIYLLLPLILAVVLVLNFITLIRFGNRQMSSISHDITQHMKIEFEQYLIPVETLINGLVTNVEQMMDEGAGYKEFEDYLVRQTDLMTGDFAKDSSGLYAYINGQYIDGAHWVPPEDYVPEERDWYKDAVDAGYRISYVAPYIDMQTGDSSVTVAHLLKDGKSVIALDLKVTSLQAILNHLMEEVKDGENDPTSIAYKKSTLGQANGKYIL